MTVAGLVTAHDLVLAVRATMLAHLPAALQAVAGADPVLPMPKSHEAPTMEAVRRNAVEVPTMVVVTAGMEGPLARDEYGRYSARWPVIVQFLVRSTEGTYEATQRDVHRYAAAIRTVFIERPDLDGFAYDVGEVSEADYDEGEPEEQRTLGEGAVSAMVTVLDVARTGTTFTEPGPAPVPASDTEITINPV